MNAVSVWAPFADQISVTINNQSHPLMAASDGWWRSEGEVLPPDARYGFVINGEGPFPDPRSPYQPDGIHGLSQNYRQSAYQWNDQHWCAPPFESAIIYELHIGTFTPEGTYTAAINKLNYLREFGVTHVELMPVNQFSGERGWGYDGAELFAPHCSYGTPDELKALVDACHAHGLAVIMDVVYNHLGPTGNYLGKFGPYFTSRYHTPWGDAVNFDDHHSDEVRRYFIDNALMWLKDYHCDGLRLDAVHAIFDRSAKHFLKQLSTEVQALENHLRRPLSLIAESDLNDPQMVTDREHGGLGMDAQWSDDFHHAIHALLTGERAGYYDDFGSVGHLASALTGGFIYTGEYSKYRKRAHGEPLPASMGNRLLGYSQTHDQVGNRAKGERSSQLLSPQQLKISAALVLCSPFVPMLFQGEEWAASTPFLYFTDHQEPELAKAVSEGRRSEFKAFGWSPEEIPNPQEMTTFEASRLRWEEIDSAVHSDMLSWYKQLIQLRKAYPELTDGNLRALKLRFDEEAQWLYFSRGRVTLVCNFSDERQTIDSALWAGKKIRLASCDTQLSDNRLALPGHSVVILGVE